VVPEPIDLDGIVDVAKSMLVSKEDASNEDASN